MKLLIDRIESDIGNIVLASDRERLCALDFEDDEPVVLPRLQRRFPEAQVVEADDPQGFTSCIRAYLAGELHVIDDVPVSTNGTEFQRQVWRALRDIPPGTTTSYGDLASRIGKPTACRAVGLANGRNPVAIVVPCHRVIGADGALTGYGGGLHRKRWLLAHEGLPMGEARANSPQMALPI